MKLLSSSIPLVIGVTGHRDIPTDALPELAKAVSDVFVRLKRDYLQNRSTTPIVVLSALAEGADQLVAAIALQHGAHLIVPLPMPLEEYRRDFEEKAIRPDAAENFKALMGHDNVSKLVIPFAAGNSIAAVQHDYHKRNEQYRAAGLFIARHCDALIALWDGQNDVAVGVRLRSSNSNVTVFRLL
jgi:hypothetical protein